MGLCRVPRDPMEFLQRAPGTYFFFIEGKKMYKLLKNESVEITNKCNLVIEFIIPKFIEGSTCFERHTAHHQ